MMDKMHKIWRGGTHIPQEALHLVRKIWKLRAIVVLLIALCTVLATVHFQGHVWIEGNYRSAREAFSKLSLLEKENQEKDATIEQLQKEKQVLEEKLTFKRKIDALVAKVWKEAPWIDEKTIRAAAEKAFRHTTDPALYLAIALVEADLQARVVHADGVALGMHGICPKDWHPFLKKKGIMQTRNDYFDPVKSFKGSEAVLTVLVRECGSLEKALRYYNGGEPAAAGLIPRSTAYARRVLHLRKVFAA